MFDLAAFDNYLQELRDNGFYMTKPQIHDCIDYLRSSDGLRSYAAMLLDIDNVPWKCTTKDPQERLAWLGITRQAIDLLRIKITSYLTRGEVTSWSDGKRPEVYFAITELIRSLQPREIIELIKVSIHTGVPDKYAEINNLVHLKSK